MEAVLTNHRKRRILVLSLRIILITAVLVGWEVGAGRGWVDPFVVSQPSAILAILGQWFRSAAFYGHLLVTLQEVVLGYLIGVVLGIVTAYWLAMSPQASRVLQPIIVAINSMPRLVFAPLLVAWFGFGIATKVVLVVFLIFFMVFFNVYSGLKEVSSEILDNAQILGASRTQLFIHVYFPAALSWIIAGLRTGIGFAFVGAITGEYIGSSKGLGFLISWGLAMFQSAQTFAGLIVLITIVGIVDWQLQRIQRRYSHWLQRS